MGNGKLQGSNEQLVDAPSARLWSILEDSSVLPRWVPIVETVTSHAQREGPGTVRRCNVEMAGTRGYLVERCVEAIAERKLSHAVEDDSLGFTKMFADYSFTLTLEPQGSGSTLARCETFYNPRGVLSRVMNALVMRRKFGGVRRRILLGLKQFAEQDSHPGTPGR
ncbi:SRPBCC family protein [Rhodococcus koreensis]